MSAHDDVQWWQSGTVYQVYPRSFADSDGDGLGDLRGVLAHVDYLQWLGVDAVWLCPVYRSPQKDNGYDISEYREIDPRFGTLEQLDELIAALKERGIRLIMDLVVNHTSDQHPWFVESRSSVSSDKRDWYIWRPPRAGAAAGEVGAEPTNWESYFSRPSWTLDERSGEYYLHLFAPEQPDLNWENPEVREAIYAMMRWWLDRGVGGFRMDVINLISKRYPLADGPLTGRGPLGSGRQWYLHGPRLHEYLSEMREKVFAGRDAALIRIGETPDITIEQARELSDPSRSMLDMVFQFEHVALDRSADDWHEPLPLDRAALFRNLLEWQRGLSDLGWNSLYWTNHDQPRTVSRFGNDSPEHWANSAKTLATVLYLMRGTAFVYQGEEIGMMNMPFSSLEAFDDVSSVEYAAARRAHGDDPAVILRALQATSRDNARTPMQWTCEPKGGFTSGNPWFPLNPNVSWLSVDAQREDSDSVLSHVRTVIAVRKQFAPIRSGAFEPIVNDDGRVVSYQRVDGGERVVVVANCSNDQVDIGSFVSDDAVELTSLRVGSVRGGAFGPWASRVYSVRD